MTDFIVDYAEALKDAQEERRRRESQPKRPRASSFKRRR